MCVSKCPGRAYTYTVLFHRPIIYLRIQLRTELGSAPVSLTRVYDWYPSYHTTYLGVRLRMRIFKQRILLKMVAIEDFNVSADTEVDYFIIISLILSF